MVTDNGPQFISSEFESFLVQNGIDHLLTPPYHPKSNGQAENFVKTFKTALRRAKGKDSRKSLQDFLMRYRITPHISTGKAPCELLNQRHYRTVLDLVKPSAKPSRSPHICHLNSRSFAIHQKVWIKHPRRKQHWIKGVIQGRVGSVIFEVLDENFKVRRVHADHLKNRVTSDASEGLLFPVSRSPPVERTASPTEFPTPASPGGSPRNMEHIPRYPQRRRMAPERFQSS